MAREPTDEEAKFMRSLRRLMARQPDSCVIYFAANSANLHDISEVHDAEFDPLNSIDSAPYVGRVDVGDY